MMRAAAAFMAMSAFALVLCAAPAVAAKFTLTDSEGKKHTLADYRGKWVIVNFWATWCPPCLEEIPDLVAISDARTDVKVFGVAMGYQDPRQVLQFAEGMFVSYPIVLGDEKIAKQIGEVAGLPTTFIYDPKGKLAQRFVGKVTREQIEQLFGER
jgi:thiol-disulfide isomerase/thioredoxin